MHICKYANMQHDEREYTRTYLRNYLHKTRTKLKKQNFLHCIITSTHTCTRTYNNVKRIIYPITENVFYKK